MAVIALAAGKGHKRYYPPTLDHPQSLFFSQKVSSNQSKFDVWIWCAKKNSIAKTTKTREKNTLKSLKKSSCISWSLNSLEEISIKRKENICRELEAKKVVTSDITSGIENWKGVGTPKCYSTNQMSQNINQSKKKRFSIASETV